MSYQESKNIVYIYRLIPHRSWTYVKFMFSKKATKIDKIFTVDLTVTTHTVKLTVKILSIFVAFSENVNFTYISRYFAKGQGFYIKLLKILTWLM